MRVEVSAQQISLLFTCQDKRREFNCEQETLAHTTKVRVC